MQRKGNVERGKGEERMREKEEREGENRKRKRKGEDRKSLEKGTNEYKGSYSRCLMLVVIIRERGE